jgi:molecular chaperone IbpA
MTQFHPSFGKDFDKLFVGFDDTYNRITKMHDDLTKNIPNYPPYNIRKLDDNRYVIEIAVAGFSKSEIEVEFADDKLTVKGNAQDDNDASDWLYRGIATRNFTRTFALDDKIEIKGAALINGMLKIALEKIIPDHKKPKKIQVSDEPSTVSKYTSKNPPQFLVEDSDEDTK